MEQLEFALEVLQERVDERDALIAELKDEIQELEDRLGGII
jgi:prefoldin subunit 5